LHDGLNDLKVIDINDALERNEILLINSCGKSSVLEEVDSVDHMNLVHNLWICKVVAIDLLEGGHLLEELSVFRHA
jgi:hypothetical protein